MTAERRMRQKWLNDFMRRRLKLTHLFRALQRGQGKHVNILQRNLISKKRTLCLNPGYTRLLKAIFMKWSNPLRINGIALLYFHTTQVSARSLTHSQKQKLTTCRPAAYLL